jgi:hypothetical protein
MYRYARFILGQFLQLNLVQARHVARRLFTACVKVEMATMRGEQYPHGTRSSLWCTRRRLWRRP